MIKISIVGFGNIGRAVYDAVLAAGDMEVVSIVSSQKLGLPVTLLKSYSQIRDVDVAILCLPSTMVPQAVSDLLKAGVSTVDSFDIHKDIAAVVKDLDKLAKTNNRVAILGAGWDPGTDSVIRALSLAMIPSGDTYTNFGPGMSMGHSVAAKSVEGVKDALSITIPLGYGKHRRMVYVELEEGANFEEIEMAVKGHKYFVNDETHVEKVPDVDALKNTEHGVHLLREGVSGKTPGQKLEFSMRVDNPSLTGQVMVSAARAATRQAPGAYTLIQIPPIDYLPGEKDKIIDTLV